MTLTERLEELGNGFRGLGIPSSHYFRPVKDAPMLIWAEDGSVGFRGDNKTEEQLVSGTVDYFTNVEYDRNVDTIQFFLNRVCSHWSLRSVQYEDETNLIHVEWEWVY